MLLQLLLLQASLGVPSDIREPVEYIERVRGLLDAGKTVELDNLFGLAQRSAEKGDPSRLNWALYGVRATGPGAERALGRWQEKSPLGWQSLLANSARWREGASTARGSKSAAETTEAQFSRMRTFDARTIETCERALVIKSNLCACHAILLDAANVASEPTEHLLTRGYQMCPIDYDVVATEVMFLTPRWGGSYPEMESAIAAAKARGLPAADLSALRALIVLDKVATLFSAGQEDAADALLNAGIAAAPTVSLHRRRAWRFQYLKQPALALAEANESIRRSNGGWQSAPGNLARLLVTRAWALHGLRREEDARSNIRAALAIQPDSGQASKWARQLAIPIRY